jgi:hypothetical protein
MNFSLPTEIITHILSYISIADLVRAERTCRLFQSFALSEIENRIIKSGSSKDEWGILVRYICIHCIMLRIIFTKSISNRFILAKSMLCQFVLIQRQRKPIILF